MRSLLDAVLVLDLLEDLRVLDLPRRAPLLEVLDPVADFLVDGLVELHVLLADILDLAAQDGVVCEHLVDVARGHECLEHLVGNPRQALFAEAELFLIRELPLGAAEMRIGKTTNFQDVLGALGELLVDADVLLEDRSGIELRLVAIADLDITRLCQRGDDLGRDGVDLPWIQSHSRGTVGSGRLTCKARSRLSLSFSVDVHDRKDRKSTRLNSSHLGISYAVFCVDKKS